MASTVVLKNSGAESVIAIWLDAEVNLNEDNRKAQEQLRKVINRVKTFEKKDECEKYIESLSLEEQVLIIVSGRLGKGLVTHIHVFSQIKSIYVYCQNKEVNEQWANHFTKVKAVVVQFDELISRIRMDLENLLSVNQMDTLLFSLKIDKTVATTAKSTAPFVFPHCLFEVLLQIKSNEKDKNDLISLCKNIYKGSETELNNIDEFQQNYTSNKALWWYTYASFIYKMLDKAFQEQDINRIFLFQFFINDMHRQLIENKCQYRIKVYRGRHLLDYQLKKIKEAAGGFISRNTFLSTTVDRDLVLHFLNTNNNSNNVHRVLYEIDADPALVKTKPFADIIKHSYFPGKSEVLFAIGAFFRVTSVQQNDDKLWIVQMTLCADDDPDLKLLFDKATKKFGCCDGEAALFSFSRMLRAMNKFDEAEKYCHRLLQQFSSDEPSLIIIHDELAKIVMDRDNHIVGDPLHGISIDDKKETECANLVNSIAISDGNDDSKSPDIPGINNSTSEDAASHEETKGNLRFTDVLAEKHEILLPIEGHEKMPLVSLEEAVIPLLGILPDIRRKVHTAKLICKNPADGLTPDQSAAIMLYTMQWEPKEECLYFALNTRLRTADRNILKPWFLYLKLILTGLARLPSIERTVYRGVKRDLSSEYPKDKQFFWWGFSSCTTMTDILKSEQFLGDSGMRTFFLIECKNGKDIGRHSYYKKEEEILLLPATYLEVKSSLKMAPDLHVIQLIEIESEYPYLEPVV